MCLCKLALLYALYLGHLRLQFELVVTTNNMLTQLSERSHTILRVKADKP